LFPYHDKLQCLPLPFTKARGMSVTNTLAYYDTATITAVKSFTLHGPGHI